MCEAICFQDGGNGRIEYRRSERDIVNMKRERTRERQRETERERDRQTDR